MLLTNNDSDCFGRYVTTTDWIQKGDGTCPTPKEWVPYDKVSEVPLGVRVWSGPEHCMLILGANITDEGLEVLYGTDWFPASKMFEAFTFTDGRTFGKLVDAVVLTEED